MAFADLYGRIVKATGWTYRDIDRLGLGELEEVIEHVLGLRKPRVEMQPATPEVIDDEDFARMVRGIKGAAALQRN